MKPADLDHIDELYESLRWIPGVGNLGQHLYGPEQIGLNQLRVGPEHTTKKVLGI